MRPVFSIITIISGLVFMVFAKPISKRVSLSSEIAAALGPRYRGWLDTALILGVGCSLVWMGLLLFGPDPWPWRTIMSRDENCLALLDEGKITQGEVTRVFYQRAAPKGWRMDYGFSVPDPATSEDTRYVGSAMGPQAYYAPLSRGAQLP